MTGPDNDDDDLQYEPPPPCERCRAEYRLVGIEGTDRPHHDLYTFECSGCGDIQTTFVRIQ